MRVVVLGSGRDLTRHCAAHLLVQLRRTPVSPTLVPNSPVEKGAEAFWYSKLVLLVVKTHQRCCEL